jgi:hypothetical protein
MTSFYMALLYDACLLTLLLRYACLLHETLCTKRSAIDRTMIVSAVWWALLFALFQVRTLLCFSTLMY